jgi:hypothetical protein
MEIRNSGKSCPTQTEPGHFRCFDFRVPLLAFAFLAGCAVPGEPTPPSPPIPVAVSDLSAHQQGDGVQLTFTLPDRTVSGDRLASPPSVEILRGSLKPNGTPEKKSFRLVYTIPGALVDTYSAANHIQFTDPISPQDTITQPSSSLAYRIRTRASRKRASANSNTVIVHLFPVPKRIGSVEVRVTESSIDLSWPIPQATSAGTALENVSGYRVYRGEIDPASAQAAASDISQAKWISPLLLLAPAPSNSYRDTLFGFGKTYLYVVRSIVIANGEPLESDGSVPAVVTPRDIFPPAVPQNVVADFVTLPSGSSEVDLSWSINLETDLAGYRVYRSEQQGIRGQLLTPDLLLTPAYRDMSVQPGHRYWYTVTAIDRAGNESLPSSPAAVALAQPSP